jgi:hypothetical protein
MSISWNHVCFSEGVAVGNYACIEVSCVPLAGGAPFLATTLASDRRDADLLPSRRYMAALIAGAEEHGLPADYVAALRHQATCEETEEARRVRPLLDEVMRRRQRAKSS